MLDHGLDLEQLARDAIARGADCLGMAGGDGSQALVASIAVEHDLPFVCVTAGTRNHFALDLGLDRDDPASQPPRLPRRRRAAHRLRHGQRPPLREQRVARRLRHDRPAGRLPRRQGRHHQGRCSPRCSATPGRALRPAVHEPDGDGGRRRLPDPGVEQPLRPRRHARRAAAPPARHRHARRRRRHREHRARGGQVVALSAVGQRQRSRHWHEFTAERFEVRSRSGKAYAGVDGEALELDTPLDSRSTRRGLRLLVPEGNLDAAERRRARDVRRRSGRDRRGP